MLSQRVMQTERVGATKTETERNVEQARPSVREREIEGRMNRNDTLEIYIFCVVLQFQEISLNFLLIRCKRTDRVLVCACDVFLRIYLCFDVCLYLCLCLHVTRRSVFCSSGGGGGCF